MGLVSKGTTIASIAIGLAAFSQAPEYAQQYRQRLGGAIEELRSVVADFDRDAQNSRYTRSQALDEMRRSATPFVRDRGESMQGTIQRFEALSNQRALMDQAHPVTRPLFILRNPDGQIASGAWADYEPAVPLTMPGLVYGGVGGLLMLLLARMGIAGTRRVRRRNDGGKIRVQPQPPAEPYSEDLELPASDADASSRPIPIKHRPGRRT